MSSMSPTEKYYDALLEEFDNLYFALTSGDLSEEQKTSLKSRVAEIRDELQDAPFGLTDTPPRLM